MQNQEKDVMALISSEMEHISKDRSSNGYKYRGIDDAMNALGPILKKHGVVISKKFVSKETRIDTVLKYDKGKDENGIYGELPPKEKHYRFSDVTIEYGFVKNRETVFVTEASGQGVDLNCFDKSLSVACSTAYRQMVFETFCIPFQGDQDNDAASAIDPSADTRPTVADEALAKMITSARVGPAQANIIKNSIKKYNLTPEQAKAINKAVAEGASKTKAR